MGMIYYTPKSGTYKNHSLRTLCTSSTLDKSGSDTYIKQDIVGVGTIVVEAGLRRNSKMIFECFMDATDFPEISAPIKDSNTVWEALLVWLNCKGSYGTLRWTRMEVNKDQEGSGTVLLEDVTYKPASPNAYRMTLTFQKLAQVPC